MNHYTHLLQHNLHAKLIQDRLQQQVEQGTHIEQPVPQNSHREMRQHNRPTFAFFARASKPTKSGQFA